MASRTDYRIVPESERPLRPKIILVLASPKPENRSGLAATSPGTLKCTEGILKADGPKFWLHHRNLGATLEKNGMFPDLLNPLN